MRRITFLLFATLLLASCTSLRYTGVSRIRDYNITSPQLPEAFDGYRIAFASDFHLESKFKERQLRGTVKALKDLAPDVLMLGGDYQEGCEYVEPLFDELVKTTPPDGIYAVLGNNDYERCTQFIREKMRTNGIQLLEDSTASIHRGADSIIVWGANAYAGRYATAPQRNSVDNKNRYQDTGDGNILLEIKNHKLETKNSSPFVILLTHTPDYIEEPEANIADLALAGHTHGGQVTLFGLYAPVTASMYGMRYRTGLKHNHQGTPIIISNGLGTSRRPIRMFAPTDIVIVTLRCE
jgi:predicted MPP superfamily phosphohydrolase